MDVTSWSGNSSRYKQLSVRDLYSIVTSDEFLRKTFYVIIQNKSIPFIVR